MKITVLDIEKRLHLTSMQVLMMEYSGYIPASQDGVWDGEKLEEYLLRWQEKLKREGKWNGD
jgi:hypothetical protein